MGDNQSAIRFRQRQQALRPLRNIAMRRAVETVAAHAELLKILPRQPIEIGLWRQRLVEAGIKHRHLPDPREELLR